MQFLLMQSYKFSKSTPIFYRARSTVWRLLAEEFTSKFERQWRRQSNSVFNTKQTPNHQENIFMTIAKNVSAVELFVQANFKHGRSNSSSESELAR